VVPTQSAAGTLRRSRRRLAEAIIGERALLAGHIPSLGRLADGGWSVQ
jgi:hypothetical protein